MSLLATRNIHLYGVVAPFVLAGTLCETRKLRLIDRVESTLQNMEGNAKGSTWIAISVIVLGSFALLNNSMQRSYQFDELTFPVQAVKWLENNPQQGNMLNDLNWGGYLEFYLWPTHLSFVDSMADTTGQVTMQYETIATLHTDWQEILKQHNITWAIIPPGWQLVRELTAQGWQTVYQDPTAIILIQK